MKKSERNRTKRNRRETVPLFCSTFAPDFQNKAGASHNLLTRDDESYMDSIVDQAYLVNRQIVN